MRPHVTGIRNYYMEKLNWPLEYNDDMRLNMLKDTINGVIDDSEVNFMNIADWITKLEDRVAKLEKQKGVKRGRPRKN